MGLYSEKSTVRLDGKTVVITGSNTGIGKETVKDFYKRGALVIMACRNKEKAEEAAKDITDSCKGIENTGEIEVMELDLSSLKSVRSFCNELTEKHKRIDLLINNAGVMNCPYGKTEDGFETQFGTNHLGHFLLTLLLLPNIIQSAPARIVNVSSALHKGDIDFDDLNFEKKTYSPLQGYQQSKLANILFTKELDRRLKDANITGVNVYALHPGVVNTELIRHTTTTYKTLGCLYNHIGKCFFKTPIEGAQTTIYCAIDEKAGTESGLYYADCKPNTPSSNARNMETAKKLWDVSSELVGLEDYNPFSSKF